MIPTIILLACTVIQGGGWTTRDCRPMLLTFYTERDCVVMRDRYRDHTMPRSDIVMTYECVRPRPNYDVVR